MARVMIVDDANLARRIMRMTLSSAGHEVVCEAATGADAIREYECHRPDVVMMDVTMPEMDGMEAARQILVQDPSARIVMVTSICSEEVVRESYRAGVTAFLVKPFKSDRLLNVVTSAFTASPAK